MKYNIYWQTAESRQKNACHEANKDFMYVSRYKNNYTSV